MTLMEKEAREAPVVAREQIDKTRNILMLIYLKKEGL